MSSVIRFVPPDTTLPPEIGDASAWYGPNLTGRTDWIECLSQAEIAEVESATKQLAESAKSSLDLTSINTEDFPLPTLGPRLRLLLEEVLSGRRLRADSGPAGSALDETRSGNCISWDRGSPWQLANAKRRWALAWAC